MKPQFPERTQSNKPKKQPIQSFKNIYKKTKKKKIEHVIALQTLNDQIKTKGDLKLQSF